MDDIVPISSLIHEIRGVKVMLDRDLAALYGVTTSNLNKAVKRNPERFPERYMFQLTEKENLIFQNGTSSWGGRRKLPFAFTEQGVSMLSAVLHSPSAIQVSITIIDAFVAIRSYLASTGHVTAELAGLKARVDLIQLENEQTLGAVNDLSEDVRAEIAAINDALNELSRKVDESNRKPEERPRIGFKRDS